MYFSTIYVTKLPPPLFLGQLTSPIPVPALRGRSLQTLLLSDTLWRDVPHSPPGKFLSGNLWKIFSGRLYTLWWELRNVLLRQLVCCSSRPNKDRPLFLLKKRAVKMQHHSPTWRGSRWRDVICLIFFPTAESCWQRSSCYVSYSAAEHDRLEDMSAFKRPRWSGLTSVKMSVNKKREQLLK